MSDGKKRIGKTAFSAGSAVLVLVIVVLVNILLSRTTCAGTPPKTICIHCPREPAPSLPIWTRMWWSRCFTANMWSTFHPT
jgi:hypothetical protein